MRAQENHLHIPFASLLQVLTNTILRLTPRRRMAPLDELKYQATCSVYLARGAGWNRPRNLRGLPSLLVRQ